MKLSEKLKIMVNCAEQVIGYLDSTLCELYVNDGIRNHLKWLCNNSLKKIMPEPKICAFNGSLRLASCNIMFIPKKRNQKYCSPKCYNRQKQSLKYLRNKVS